MTKAAPTSAKVVGWISIVLGVLATLSAVVNIVMGITSGNEYFSIWPHLIQIAIAAPLPFAGRGLIKGSEAMRKVLVFTCYLLLSIMLVTSVRWAMESGSWKTLLTFAVYMLPLAIIAAVLHGNSIRQYTSPGGDS